MGLFDFVKDAGASIFGKDDGHADTTRSLSQHLRDHQISPDGVDFRFEGDTVVVMGRVPDQETREKIITIVGNVKGVGKVDDRLMVGSAQAAPAADAGPSGPQGEAPGTGWISRTYTVQSGDTLSGISKKMYGDASRYPAIFEANKPMLKDPDRIYPGQVLRIPQLD